MPESVVTLPKFKPKQQIVHDCGAKEILYGGDTRAGKSFFVRKSYILWCSQIPGLQCDIFRLNYEDVVKGYMEGDTSFPVLLSEWIKSGLVRTNENEVIFWNGSKISLHHCFDDKSTEKHRGNASHVRTIDESGQIPEHRLRALAGWVTMSDAMKARVPEKWKGQFPKMIHLTNWVGPGMGFYRREFLEEKEPFKIYPLGPLQSRAYIPAYLTDNDSEDAQATIARIKEAYPDPAVQRAMLECDWRAMAGDFFPEWSEDRHVVADFTPPNHWFRFRGMDLGYAEPCAVYWVAVSDGEPFKDSEGNERWFPRGAFVIYREWYLCDPVDPSKGLRYRNEDIREGIIERSEYGHKNVPTLTDSLPFQDRGGESVPSVFANQGKGITLTLGDTSRVVGWNQLRARFIGKEMGLDQDGRPFRVPMIYLTESCIYARQYIPALQRHKSETKREDAVEHGEATHACDALRIIAMAHTVIKDKIEPTETRIQKELARTAPTMKNILRRSGVNLN